MNEQTQTDLHQTQQSDYSFRIEPWKPDYLLVIQIADENRELFRILPNGDVIAESLETASEAGKVFIESLRLHGKPLLQRIQELETENEKLKTELYEMRQGDQIF